MSQLHEFCNSFGTYNKAKSDPSLLISQADPPIASEEQNVHLTSVIRLFLMYLLALIFCYPHHGTTLPLAAFYQANPSERRRRLQSNAKEGRRRRGNTLNGRRTPDRNASRG